MTPFYCAGCETEKVLENDFFRNSIKANGYDSKCKECRKLHSKKYRIDHANEISDQRKNKYAEDREELLINKQKYYMENSSIILEKKNRYWHANKERISKRVSEWRKRNSEILAIRNKQGRDFIKSAVLTLLGPICKLCGEVEPELLTVDHVKNDGHEERYLGSIGWKRKILTGESDPSSYRVLCHNCNTGSYRINPIHHLSCKDPTGINRICIVCHDNKDTSQFPSLKSHGGARCLECRRRMKIDRQRELILEIGTCCACCGVSEWQNLTLDHIKNDGSERRLNGERSGIDILTAIHNGLIPKIDFQILCWNCNYSKHQGSGLCIHERNGSSLKNGVTPTFRNPNSVLKLDAVTFEFRDIIFSSIDSIKSCREFLSKYHYAGFGRPSSILYAGYYKNDISFLAKFSPPVRQGIAGTVGVENHQLLELDRFCIHPSYHQKNFGSYCMSHLIDMLKKDRPEILKLVSFADPRFGHSGTIYKASNWEYIGQTTKSYYYVNSSGQEINKKTVYEFAKVRKITERQCVEALGYKKVYSPPKEKFVYTL